MPKSPDLAIFCVYDNDDLDDNNNTIAFTPCTYVQGKKLRDWVWE